VNLTDWKVSEGGSNHGITASQGGESFSSGAYAILADNPTKFLEDWPAYSGLLFDTAFTSGLSNTGETIAVGTLNNGTFAPADTVSYQSSWGSAGDGNTLQRASVSGTGMTPGAPSPGTGSLVSSSSGGSNTGSGSDSGTSTTTTTTTTTTSANTPAPTSSYVAPPEPQIFADAGDNRTVIVAADTEFFGRAYNRKKETLTTPVRFLWNFGDGRTAEGQNVLHHFEYPGRYAVVLNIAENRDAASDKIIVTAEPAKLAFTALSDGSVTIGNTAGRDLDLSGWIVRSFVRSFILPKDSIILAGESLRIGDKTLGFRSSPDTELDYPNGVLALQAGTASGDSDSQASDMPAAAPASASSSPPPKAPAAPLAVSNPVAGQAEDASPPETDNTVGGIEDSQASLSQIAAASAGVSDRGGSYLWWFGAFGLAVVGGGALVAARHARKREWDIVEEG
ncbi:MAG: PKD domain-containing protein, partial [Candidatus Kaiserbacteria bacterium]|nr:PKD domain-containing protein [Candidatus Kaiserbacteria bacterium]